jgi:hypothetical protein
MYPINRSLAIVIVERKVSTDLGDRKWEKRKEVLSQRSLDLPVIGVHMRVQT